MLAELDRIAPLFDAYRQFQGAPADLAAARAFLPERFGHGDSVLFVALDAGDLDGAALVFALALLLGPLYTVPGYSPAAHVISQLAAQNTPNNVLMAAAFVLLGAAVAIDGLGARRREWLPFVGFGLAFGSAGLFGHRPIDPAVPYVAWMDQVHSVAAALSGVALTAGCACQALRTDPDSGTRWRRWMAAGLALTCVGLPLNAWGRLRSGGRAFSRRASPPRPRMRADAVQEPRCPPCLRPPPPPSPASSSAGWPCRPADGDGSA